MKMHNPQHERIKRAYCTYLAEAKGFSETTLDGVAKALNRFETYTKFRDFKSFHIEQAKGFKAHLAEQRSLRSKERLSKGTLYATVNALKQFFIWLAGQPGYKSRISYSDAEYFNLSAGKMAECILTGPCTGNLCGICPDCDRLIYRRVNLAKIDAVRGELEITFTQPPHA